MAKQKWCISFPNFGDAAMPEQFLTKLKSFFRERNWEQFHSPKNLAMDLASEMGELLDHFRWLTEEQSYKPPKVDEVRDEIGDIYIVFHYLADRLGIDPLEAAEQKLKKIAKKYPVATSRGSSLKYSDDAANL